MRPDCWLHFWHWRATRGHCVLWGIHLHGDSTEPHLQGIRSFAWLFNNENYSHRSPWQMHCTRETAGTESLAPIFMILKDISSKELGSLCKKYWWQRQGLGQWDFLTMTNCCMYAYIVNAAEFAVFTGYLLLYQYLVSSSVDNSLMARIYCEQDRGYTVLWISCVCTTVI